MVSPGPAGRGSSSKVRARSPKTGGGSVWCRERRGDLVEVAGVGDGVAGADDAALLVQLAGWHEGLDGDDLAVGRRDVHDPCKRGGRFIRQPHVRLGAAWTGRT